MPKNQDFSAFPNRISLDVPLLHSEEYPTSAYMIFDFDVPAIFGTKARVPVVLTIDGKKFRRSLSLYAGAYMMVFNAELRDGTGYKAGDIVHMTIERDLEPRVVELPEDVAIAFSKANVQKAWDAFSYSHQKEDLSWINDAKRPETRIKRINTLVEKLLTHGK
ncbi:MAG TPA: YdeI/OmpD-associated family protein [Candidatus Cloacimonadota bacterium]|nr:YdeI/OmpD-associated family protein [Candidatus Cloacimonadota bacterium]HPS38281.1 YdeI/OmpD-associated family protein [Candidatus Cloacimonadota bacterium]